MRMELNIPISKALATIFLAEFDHDYWSERWIASMTEQGLTHADWLAAKESIELFLIGLRERRLVMVSDNALFLRHPYSFLTTFTENDDTCYIESMADDYLGSRPDMEQVKIELREECDIVFEKLDAYYDTFYA
jgi:hypothetical protein